MPSIISTLNDHCLQWIGTIATEDVLHALSLTCSHLRSLYADEKTKRKHVPTEWYYLYYASQSLLCPKKIEILSIDSEIQRIRYKVTWKIPRNNTSSAIISEHQKIDHPFLLPGLRSGIGFNWPKYNKSKLEWYSFETKELLKRVAHFLTPLNVSNKVKEEICNYVTTLRDKLCTTTMSYLSLVTHEEMAWKKKCLSWQLRKRLTIDQRLYIRNVFFSIIWNKFKAKHTGPRYGRGSYNVKISNYQIELVHRYPHSPFQLPLGIWSRNGAKELRDEGDDNVIQYEMPSSETVYITLRDREETTEEAEADGGDENYRVDIGEDFDRFTKEIIVNLGNGLHVKRVDKHIVVEDVNLKTTCRLSTEMVSNPNPNYYPLRIMALNAKQERDSLIVVVLQCEDDLQREDNLQLLYYKYHRDSNTNQMKYYQVEKKMYPLYVHGHSEGSYGDSIIAYYDGIVYCKFKIGLIKVDVKTSVHVARYSVTDKKTAFLYQLEDGICYIEQTLCTDEDVPEYYYLTFYLKRGVMQIRKQLALGVNYALWIEYKGRHAHGKDEFYVHSYTNNMVRGHLHNRKFSVTKVLV
tara:strand:+ start:3138 stop:4871 length:1734 start_codon:yes stop_codon:yes gene_type:complete